MDAAQCRMIERTETDLMPWILAGVVVVIAAIGLVIASIYRDGLDLHTPKIRAAPEPLEALSVPAPIAPVDARGAISVGSPHRVWECAVNGQRTFADAPCGVGSTVRELSPVNRMDPTPAPPPSNYASPNSNYSPAYEPQYSNESTNNAGICEGLDAEVKAIDERMRHRYTNPEGEYYRDRLHKISDRKYDLHCDR
jgi:hypothetical protein